MCRLKDRKSAFSRDCAATTVSVRNYHSKSTLPQTRLYQSRFAIIMGVRFLDLTWQTADKRIIEPFLNRVP